MRSSQEDNDDTHHRAVKNHEGHLVVGQAPAEASAELGNTEGATDQDRDGGDCER